MTTETINTTDKQIVALDFKSTIGAAVALVVVTASVTTMYWVLDASSKDAASAIKAINERHAALLARVDTIERGEIQRAADAVALTGRVEKNEVTIDALKAGVQATADDVARVMSLVRGGGSK